MSGIFNFELVIHQCQCQGFIKYAFSQPLQLIPFQMWEWN